MEHIREAIEAIRTYTVAGRDEFMKTRLIQDAVVRNFEIIGEAAKQLSTAPQARHPEVPWKDIARFRDLLIHHYMEVDLKRVWNVIETRLSDLAKAVDELLES